MKLQLKRSVALDGTSPNQTPKPPTAEQMNYGELAVNYNSSFGPVVFTKDSSDNIIEIVPKLSTIVRTDQTSTQVVSSKIETLATISGDSSTTVTTKGYVDTVDATKLNLTGGVMTGDITWNSSQTFIGANVTGILSISTTGNAATATQLTNTRTIGGTGFNGTVNIDIAELNAQPASYYLDASNLNAGTVPLARLSDASTSVKGIVQLSSATNSTSEALGATSKAVKNAYDLADAALPKSGGSMDNNAVITFSSAQTFDPTKISAGTLPLTVLARAYTDGSIYDADINSLANISLDKLATGALPTAITITTFNVVDGTLTNNDISSTAAIAFSKLQTGTLPSGIQVTSANITDLEIVNSDVSNSAAIAGTKIVGATTSVVGTVQLTSVVNSTSEVLAATGLAVKNTYDLANSALQRSGGFMTGVITFNSGQTFDPTKISAGPLPSNVTVSTTNIVDGTIVDADISNTAAIAASKIVSASTSGKGVVQLSSVVNSTSEIVAATSAAVKIAYDAAMDQSEISVGVDPPSNPSQGDLWWDSSPTIGNAFIYYVDANSSQWVPMVPGTPEVDYTRVVVLDSTSAQTMVGDLLIPATTGGTSNSAAVTKLYVDTAVTAEDFWDRSGTTLSPNTAGDVANIAIAYSGTAASSFGGAGTFAGDSFNIGNYTWNSSTTSGAEFDTGSLTLQRLGSVSSTSRSIAGRYGADIKWEIDVAGAASFVSGNFQVNAYGQTVAHRTDSDSYPICTYRNAADSADGITMYGSGAASFADTMRIGDPAGNSYGQGMVMDPESASGSYMQIYCVAGQANNPLSIYRSDNFVPFSVTAAGAATFAGYITSNQGYYTSLGSAGTGSTSLFKAWYSSSTYVDILDNGDATFEGSITAAGVQASTFQRPGDSGIVFSGGTLYGTDGSGTTTNGSLSLGTSSYELNNAYFAGYLSKGSGSFTISHPLPEKTETHHLVHSFIEGPQADLIYSGMVTLVAGKAEINLDTAARMTEGTFLLLNTNLRRFVSNEGGWTAVRSSITGNVLTVEAQDDTCTDEVFWTVIGERKDQHMLDTEWTDENGRVITEPLKPVEENS